MLNNAICAQRWRRGATGWLLPTYQKSGAPYQAVPEKKKALEDHIAKYSGRAHVDVDVIQHGVIRAVSFVRYGSSDAAAELIRNLRRHAEFLLPATATDITKEKSTSVNLRVNRRFTLLKELSNVAAGEIIKMLDEKGVVGAYIFGRNKCVAHEGRIVAATLWQLGYNKATGLATGPVETDTVLQAMTTAERRMLQEMKNPNNAATLWALEAKTVESIHPVLQYKSVYVPDIVPHVVELHMTNAGSILEADLDDLAKQGGEGEKAKANGAGKSSGKQDGNSGKAGKGGAEKGKNEKVEKTAPAKNHLLPPPPLQIQLQPNAPSPDRSTEPQQPKPPGPAGRLKAPGKPYSKALGSVSPLRLRPLTPADVP